MKVTNNTVKTFKPVELNIVFETQEEIDAFARMCGQNIGVACWLADRTTEAQHYEPLKNMLDMMYRALRA